MMDARPGVGRMIGRLLSAGATQDAAARPPTSATAGHPALEQLPEWPLRTVAILATVDRVPYAIPVSAPVRAADRSILIALKRSRGSLGRLRRRPEVALAVLAGGNVAFTARGRAQVVEEHLAATPDYAAVAIDVEQIDDHRQPAFEVESGVGRRWLDEDEQRTLRERIRELQELAEWRGSR
jgi:hypothetical protein